jgi:hypothetical protein
MRISRNFSEWELTISRQHPELSIPFDELEPRVLAHSIITVHTMMQPIRDVAGWLDVLSFIRSLELNDAVGGKVDSDHLRGLCVDFRPRAMSCEDLWLMAQNGELAHADFDKLNYYPARRSFHGAIRPLEDGLPRRRLYLDWQRIN